jgi:hypothetical protein
LNGGDRKFEVLLKVSVALAQLGLSVFDGRGAIGGRAWVIVFPGGYLFSDVRESTPKRGVSQPDSFRDR